MTDWWAERGALERFDLYTRGTLYVLMAGEVVLAFGLVTSMAQPVPVWWAVVFVGVAAVHATLGIVVLSGGMRWYLGHGPWPRRASIAVGVTTVLGYASSMWMLEPARDSGPSDGFGPAVGGVMLFTCFLVLTFTPGLRTSRLTVATGGAAVLVGATVLVVGWPAVRAVGAGTATALALAGGASAFRASVWMLGVMWELERSRRTQAELAVAEERLRFARDLHDVLGRNLSVMALKSELAAQLARRGRDEAGDEMMAVRDIAQESLREVREVVRGYREADLSTELVGARSVLRAAGVDTRVVGDGMSLPAGVQSVLGWVAREGTTNILRHSTAGKCVITVGADDGMATLTMDNDGARAETDQYEGGEGSGLRGLEERLRRIGGTLVVCRPSARSFRLTASVPRSAQVEET